MKQFTITSLFSGAGGLDLGFEQAGFKIIWGNDYDKSLWETFEKNFSTTKFDRRSILNIKSNEIPDADGILGGPPCQSWSLAGSMKGIQDKRGQLFYEYIRVLKDKMPLFFLAENVPGILSKTHLPEFNKIIDEFEKTGYAITYRKIVAADYGVPQERKRVFIVGFRKDLNKKFVFPKPTHGERLKPYITQKDAFGDLPDALPALSKNKSHGENLKISNHEYFIGEFSSRFMSRNRRRGWGEIAYTVEASGRHAKLHPSASPMVKIGTDNWKFDENSQKPYRRLSVRESARIQGFPDSFTFHYTNIDVGYKLIGNAVPVKLAHVIAEEIKKQLVDILEKKAKYISPEKSVRTSMQQSY
jgi:DNA (cytosine-5)-methyltransferase 1